jgi:sn-glycerol 3-phosphate transport system permease protein
MPSTTPILILIIAALVGAVFTYFTSPRRAGVYVVVGAVAGAVGSLIFMLPLNFCTFEAEKPALDVAFGVLLIIIGMTLVIVPARWLANRLLNKETLITEGARPGTFRGRWIPFVLLAPTLIILALFLYYPSLDTLRLSTLLYRLGAPRSAFVCVDNFTRLVDPEYGRSILTTFGMSFAIVVIGLGLGLLIATAAYQPISGARIYRTLLIWPYAISPVVAGIIFGLLFNPAGGIINKAWEGLFGVTIPWLNNPTYAPWAVIIASVWKSLGFNILFYIAGLQNIPGDLLEAASIDGANRLQKFFRVTFPLLSPITFFLVITNVTYAFFETVGTLVYLTGGAGPLGSTNTLMYRIYQLGIQNNDMGKAAAQSIVLFMIVIGLTVIQFRTASNRVTYGGA